MCCDHEQFCLQDLVEAVTKINSQLGKHIGQNEVISFTENDIEPLGYGKFLY